MRGLNTKIVNINKGVKIIWKIGKFIIILVSISVFIGIILFVLVYVVLPILNPYHKFNYILGIFPILLILLIGVIDIRYAFKFKKNKLNIYIPFGILTISEANVKILLGKGLAKGDGSQNNPFQILDYSKLPSTIILVKIESFLQINNAELNVLELKKCKNVQITNCKIKRFELIYCTDVIIENNVIQIFKIENSWKNLIKNNKISEKYLRYLNKNKASKFPFDDMVFFIAFSIATIFLGYMSIKSHFFYIFTIMFIMSIGGWSMMFFSFIVKLKYYLYPKKSPNIKSENRVIR